MLRLPDVMLSYFLVVNRMQDQQTRADKISAGGSEIGSFFLDSGAFSHWSAAADYAKKTGAGRWDYFNTPEYWGYLDAYARFVKDNADVIDFYANVDVVQNPELTYRNQKYLEETHGLSPVPVYHYKSPARWLERYISEGYGLVGFGGLVGSTGKDECVRALDTVFDGVICRQPDRMPRVRVHGFGVTGYRMVTRYPWWSVDSATWTKLGSNGAILVPRVAGGDFTFKKPPLSVAVSREKPAKSGDMHYASLTAGGRKHVRRWLDRIGVAFGRTHPTEVGEDGKPAVLEYGVTNRHSERKIANLLYFEGLRASLPEWPWPFAAGHRRGFGLC